MPASKSLDIARAAELFHALSDEIRLEVVTVLLTGEHCVCDLMTHTGLAQSRLSWHLKTLVDADIITSRREGRWNYYALNTNTIAEVRGLLDGLKPGKRLPVQSVCCA